MFIALEKNLASHPTVIDYNSGLLWLMYNALRDLVSQGSPEDAMKYPNVPLLGREHLDDAWALWQMQEETRRKAGR